MGEDGQCPSHSQGGRGSDDDRCNDRGGATGDQPRDQGQQGAHREGGKRRRGGLDRRTQIPGVDAEFFAGVGLKRELGSAHHLAGELPGHIGLDPSALIDPHQFPSLAFGAVPDFVVLQSEFALEQLRLGPHGDVLPRRHRKGTGHQSGHPGQSHDGSAGMGTGETEDERHVGHQPVAHAEHRGARPAGLDATVMVVTGLQLGTMAMGGVLLLPSLAIEAPKLSGPRDGCVLHHMKPTDRGDHLVFTATCNNGPMPGARNWFDNSQPQTLQSAVLLSYLTAALGLFFFVLGNHSLLQLVSLALAPGAYGIANDKRWGYRLNVAMAIAYAALCLLSMIYISGSFVLSLLFAAVLVALLLHPQSREYKRIWFR